jgi:hypothetical protein
MRQENNNKTTNTTKNSQKKQDYAEIMHEKSGFTNGLYGETRKQEKEQEDAADW